jgi:hypothetical protein
MSLFGDYMDESGAGTPSETPAVLLEGSVPPQFLSPPNAIVSDCAAVTAVV